MPTRPKNCLTDALDRLHDLGGYVGVRRSEHWPVAHALHVTREGRIASYAPPGKLDHPLQALAGFEGELHDDDPAALAQPMSIAGIVVSAWLCAFGATIWAISRGLRRIA